MSTSTVPNRLYASLPADDPRFAELRTVLGALKRTGKSSPTARMLGEWALVGFLLTTGRIPLGSIEPDRYALPGDLPDPDQVLYAKQQLEHAAAQLGGFDD